VPSALVSSQQLSGDDMTRMEPVGRLEIESAAWQSFEDRIVAFMEEHPEIDSQDDAIEALIWGQENTDADE
jgi:hypothetical protein